MNAYAAVTTGKGVGAIATVCVIGDGAGNIIRNIFQANSKNKLTTNEHELTRINLATEDTESTEINKDINYYAIKAQFEVGKILLGTIADGEKVIDQVVVGCEGENEFAINCHGNPLIVEMIMELLVKHGAEAVSAERFLQSKIQSLSSTKIGDLKSKIAIEVKIEQVKAKTLEGYKLLQNQIEGGLTAKAAEWIKAESLGHIQKEAVKILKASQAAQYIIHGCKVVLAGPANSGKSTLLNCLAGREKSIVADIPGTTRDWVSAHCISGNLAMEIIDTAGLDESLTADNAIDKAAQERSVELIRQADVLIWVIDGSDKTARMPNSELRTQDKVILAINKSDLGLKAGGVFEKTVVISAKTGTGIEELTKKIRTVLGVERFDLRQPICFADRQKQLLQKIVVAKDRQEVKNALVNSGYDINLDE